MRAGHASFGNSWKRLICEGGFIVAACVTIRKRAARIRLRWTCTGVRAKYCARSRIHDCELNRGSGNHRCERKCDGCSQRRM